MGEMKLRVRRPPSPLDALSADLADEVDVQVLPGGDICYGTAENSRLYNEDSAFLHSIIDTLRLEVEKLEKEVKCRRTTRMPRRLRP